VNEARDQRIDALVRAADERARSETSEDRLAAERDKQNVMMRIGAERPADGSAHEPHRMRTPWWRVAAPIAVAASLVGLFVLRDQLQPGELLTEEITAPTTLDLPAEDRAREVATSSPTDEASDAAETRDRDTTEEENLLARRTVPPVGAARIVEPERDATSMKVSRVEPETARGMTLTRTADLEVAEILDRLGPADAPRILEPAVRDSLVEVLRTLRPGLTDSARAERVDAWIAPRD